MIFKRIVYCIFLLSVFSANYVSNVVYANDSSKPLVSTVKVDDEFKSDYKNMFFMTMNDKHHFKNKFGSCGFNAITMMLSYYDTFFDGNLIYDGYQTLGQKKENILINPPGIKYYESDNAKDFYELNKEGTLLGQLFDIYNAYPHVFNVEAGDYTLLRQDVYRIFKDYVFVSSCGRMIVKELEFHNLKSINEKINEGYPLLIFARKEFWTTKAHVFIAYGLYNNITICNMGYGDDMSCVNGLDEYTQIMDAMYIEILDDYHNCSKIFDDGICYCRYTRPHEYTIKPYDDMCHIRECQCGLCEYEAHKFIEKNGYYVCVQCHAMVKNSGSIIVYRRREDE